MFKEKEENLTQQEVESKSKEVSCVMNRMNIFNEKETYISYTCNSCPGKPENICYLCYENCHKNHNNNTKNVNEKRLEISKTPCSCAANDHKVEKQEFKLGYIRTDAQELQCTLNEVLNYSNLQYFYMDPTTHMYYCIYCLDYCLGIFSADVEDPLAGYIKRERSKFAQGAPLCSCSNKDSHCPFYENVASLVSLVKTPSFDRFINRVQIPGQIISKSSLIEKYLEPIKAAHFEIAKNYKEGNISKYQKEQLPKIYVNSLELFSSFSEVFGKDVHLMTNPNVQNYYSYDFLYLIFSRSDDSLLIDTKINSLIFFRKFYLLPLIKYKEWHMVYTDLENVSPLHRLLFRPHILDFFALVKIDKNNFARLINRIHLCIVKYSEKLDEKNLARLIIEYLKYLFMLISFKFTPLEEFEDSNNNSQGLSNAGVYSFYHEIIDKFVQIVDLIYQKKSFENLIKKYLEIFVTKVMLTNNDSLFLEKVFGSIHSRLERNEIRENNYHSRNFTSLYNLNTSRHFLSNNNSFHELNEEEGNEEINEEGDYVQQINQNFCFQKGELEIKLIRSLFAFAKEETDKSSEIKNWELYDILMHHDDYYKEIMTNLLKSDLVAKGVLSSDLRHLFTNSEGIVNNAKLFTEEDISYFKLIKEDMTILEGNKIKYYDSNINENVLYSICMKTFPSIQGNLSLLKLWGEETISNNKENNKVKLNLEQMKKSVHKQIYLFKSGCFDTLLNIWVIFNSNGYIKETFEKEKMKNLNKNILEIFKLLTVNNSFLCSLFFNPHFMDVIFSAHCGVNIQISRAVNSLLNLSEMKKHFNSENDFNIKEFYLFLLKTLHKQNYKLNLIKFISESRRNLNYLLQVKHLYSDPEKKDFISVINLILRSFRICLKISDEKSIWKSNNYIVTEMRNILNNQEGEGISLSGHFQEKLSEFKNNSCKIDQVNKEFILEVYKNIFNIEDHYFIMFIEYINIEEVESILLMEKELDPLARRVFTNIYSKYHVECPFKIIHNVKNGYFDLVTKSIDLNVIGRLGDLVEEEESALGSYLGSVDLTASYKLGSRSSSKKPSMKLKNEQMLNFQKRLKEREMNPNAQPKKHPLKPINILLTNLEKYRRIVITNIEAFKGNHKFFVKYFTDVCLYPSIFTIYKILYFSPRTTAKFKYLNYKCVYLFLECLKFFLIMITTEKNKLFHTEESEKCYSDFFLKDNPNQDLKEFLNYMIEELTNDLAVFVLPSFEPLKLNVVMEKWMYYVRKLKIVDFLQGEKSSFGEQKESQVNPGEIDKLIVEFIQEYKEKKLDLDNNVLIALYTNTQEDDLRSKALKKTITLDLIFRINTRTNDAQNQNNLNPYNEDNMIMLDIINKLFKSDPDFWQSIITLTCSTSKKQLFGLIREQIAYLAQFIFIDFHKLSRLSGKRAGMYTSSLSNYTIIIEFLRLHCENHNKIFQTFLSHVYVNYGEIDLIDFILKLQSISLINIEYFKTKKEVIKYFKSYKTVYFNPLMRSVTNYLIELIQGAFESNFRKVASCSEFIFYYETAYRFFDCVENEEEYEIYLSEFMRFLTCYLDENSNPTENKIAIIKKFNPQKMLQVLMHCFKKIYFKFVINKNREENIVNSINIHDLSVPEGASDQMIFIFLQDEELINDGLFILCSEIFKYFKTAILWKSGERVEKLLDTLKKLTELPVIPEKNKQVTILKREVYKFFSTVVKEVEVFYRFKNNMEEIELNKFRDFFEEDFYDFEKVRAETKIELQGIQKVVYLVHPDSLFLKDSDIDKFAENAPFENFNLKLTYILNYYTTLLDTVQMRKNLWMKNSKILNFFFTLNYQKALYFSIILSVIVNILVLVSTNGKPELESEFNYTPFPGDNQVLAYTTTTSKTFSISHYFNHLDYDKIILSISAFHLFYLFIVISNFLSFSLYSIQKFIHARENFTFSDKITNTLSLFANREVAPLTWNFLMGLIAIMRDNHKFVYSLQLFAIFNLVPTMQSVIYSVRVRYKQFLSAGLLISIIILFYSSISFYLFRDEFYNDELGENMCSSFLHCFLTLMTNGIRAGNGLGFRIHSIRSKEYFSEFIFEWIFYFSVILIMINVINGIIVDTFQALREQNNLKEDIQENVCYICSINRSKFEIRGVNFHHHKNIEHNILNYFFYILKVRLTNEQDLNSLDYQVLNYIKDLRTDFFPVKKALSLGDDSK